MSEVIGIVSFVVSGVISVSVVAVIVYLIVRAIKNKDSKKSKSEFPTKILFQIYLYLMTFLTLLIAVIGGATAIKSVLASQFGTPFAYTLYKGTTFEEMKMYDTTINEDTFEVCPGAEVLTLGDSDFCFDAQAQQSDLVIGLTLLISMSILFAVHEFAISRIPKKDRLEWVEKINMFASLILYSVIGLISIPVSIYQLTNFLTIRPEDYAYSTPEAPGMAIGIALLSLPLWIYFVIKSSKAKSL